MRIWRRVLLSAVLLFLASQRAPAVEPTPAERLALQDRVLVIAHRGDSQAAPENTLPAFRSAVRAGADLVELDYYHSADGVPIVFHDKDLDRTSNAVSVFGGEKIPVGSKTFDELRRLDAGIWFGAQFAGAKIPTLQEALDVIQNGSVTLIERKGGDAATCIELLKKKDLLARVVVQAFDWEYVRDCHAIAPGLVLAALGDKELSEQKLDEIEKTGARVVGWNQKHLAQEQIEAIHARGLKVWSYTINDEARARELIAAGLDGIITDRPAAMLQLIGAKQLK